MTLRLHHNTNRQGRFSPVFFVFAFVCFVYSISLVESIATDNVRFSISNVTVSGFSDGGFFASQFQICFSATVKGVGMFGGGPYYCAEGDFIQANTSCSAGPPPSVAGLIAAATAFESDGLIDALIKNNADTRAYIFTGSLDTVHAPSVGKAAAEFYQNITENVLFVEIPAPHCIPTSSNNSLPCNSTAFPFINNCQYNGVDEMFSYLFNSTFIPPLGVAANNTHLIRFTQNSTRDGLAQWGYVYLPLACQEAVCPLHVFFHSQGQGASFDEFVQVSPFNSYAEKYGIVILYPHSENEWDWYGATNPDYAFRVGLQISSVSQIISNLTNIDLQ